MSILTRRMTFLIAYLLFMPSFVQAKENLQREKFKDIMEDVTSLSTACKAVGYVNTNCEKNEYVAFDTRMGSSPTLKKGEKAIFEEVNLNVKGGYNFSTGIFTAPIAGLYIFDWTIWVNSMRRAGTVLSVNGMKKSHINCYAAYKYGRTFSCSKMAIVRMEVGDKAWIYSSSGNSYIGMYSSFSGFKL
ncbi:collagen alpha-2(VIII) chain-like [Saccostrea cucullata]|uniref:collagen alpha-2(VIII) chain-like n=1 Tax=Saccostrea cuccullata TaxID=36930 RepID=UPI002ED01EB0